jgi:hypothetical protein
VLCLEKRSEGIEMQKLQPIAVMTESENSYRVQFQTESGKSIEYVFEIDSSGGFDLLISPIEFLALTEGDPAADRLRSSISNLHSARHFRYVNELTGTPTDVKSADASK